MALRTVLSHCLHADSIGSRVPRPAGDYAIRGRVHSVFRRACNVGMRDGELLALLDGRASQSPHGINCPGLTLDHLRVGQDVLLSARELTVPAACLVISLADARIWSGAIQRLSFGVRLPGVRRCLDRAHALLRQRGSADGFAPLLVDANPPVGLMAHFLAARLARVLPELACAAQQRDAVAMAGGCRSLLGLGIGLTPSGDDFVTGFLAALHLNDPCGLQPILPALRGLLRSALHDCHAVSRQMLTDALDGDFPETLLAVVEDLAAASDPEHSIAGAMAVGHSSGADTLCGLLFGLSPSFVRQSLGHLTDRDMKMRALSVERAAA